MWGLRPHAPDRIGARTVPSRTRRAASSADERSGTARTVSRACMERTVTPRPDERADPRRRWRVAGPDEHALRAARPTHPPSEFLLCGGSAPHAPHLRPRMLAGTPGTRRRASPHCALDTARARQAEGASGLDRAMGPGAAPYEELSRAGGRGPLRLCPLDRTRPALSLVCRRWLPFQSAGGVGAPPPQKNCPGGWVGGEPRVARAHPVRSLGRLRAVGTPRAGLPPVCLRCCAADDAACPRRAGLAPIQRGRGAQPPTERNPRAGGWASRAKHVLLRG